MINLRLAVVYVRAVIRIDTRVGLRSIELELCTLTRPYGER